MSVAILIKLGYIAALVMLMIAGMYLMQEEEE